MSLNDVYKIHDDVRAGIAAGEPGLAQIKFGTLYVSLVRKNGATHMHGAVPDKMSVDEVRGAIIDDLVDEEVDHEAMASRKGMFADDDFESRARHYEERILFPTEKDKRFAAAIREFAKIWLA